MKTRKIRCARCRRTKVFNTDNWIVADDRAEEMGWLVTTLYYLCPACTDRQSSVIQDVLTSIPR